MVINRRKKNSRQRGSWTHGWGEKKKHRGAGHRGGRGNAGSGKRGDATKPSIWKAKYFGKKGFNPHSIKCKSINISELDKLIIEKQIKEEIIDLNKYGYDKLLGVGHTKNKLQIVVGKASQKAVEKIKAAGGEVKTE